MKRTVTTALLCIAFILNAYAEEDYYKDGLQCVTSLQENHKQTSYIGLVLIDGKSHTGIYKESFSRPDQTIPAKTLILDDGNNGSLHIWSEKRIIGPMNKKTQFHPDDIAVTLENAPATYGECTPWIIEPEKFIKPEEK